MWQTLAKAVPVYSDFIDIPLAQCNKEDLKLSKSHLHTFVTLGHSDKDGQKVYTSVATAKEAPNP